MTHTSTYRLDDLDRKLIAATQDGLPLDREPFRQIGLVVGASAGEVRSRLQSLLDHGVIRRIGVVPNHYALGMTANGMSVWDVDDDMAEALGKKVGALDFVSHCYLRPRHLPQWPYNLFAMVHGSERGEVEEKALIIADLLGSHVDAHDILYSTRILKKKGLRLAA